MNDSSYPSEDSRSGRTLWVLFAIVIIGLAVGKMFSSTSARTYPERTPVYFWHQWSAEWKVVVDRICREFNKNQDKYEVVPLSIPDTITGSGTSESKFMMAVAGGEPPDCVAQWNPVIPKWADAGIITPLDDLMSASDRAFYETHYYPLARRIGEYKGKVYGLTIGLNVFACYYNIDMLREAGLSPDHLPEAYEELCEWGKQLTREADDGSLVRVGFLPREIDFRLFATVFGGGFYDWDNQQVTIDTPENLRALEYLSDYRAKIGVKRAVRFEWSQTADFGVDWPFITGGYAITLDGQWRVEQLSRYAPDLAYLTAPLPAPKGGRSHAGFGNGNFILIPRGARSPEGAWEFIKFWSGLTDPNRAALFHTWGGWLPSNDLIGEAPVYQAYVSDHPQFRTFLDLLPSPYIEPLPPVTYQLYLNDRIQRASESAMRGSMTPKEALERLKQEIDEERLRLERSRHAF